MGQFTPWGVTSSVGQASVNPQGQLGINLSPEQLAQQNMLSSGANQFYQNALQPTYGREQDIYSRIRDMQMPGEQRQYQQMQAQANAQGRGGIRSAQFGGSPEQFAFAQAQQEAQNQASLMALQQAQAEQLQQANLGNIYQTNQYLPLNAILSSMNPAIQSSQLQNQANQYNAGLWGQMATGGLEGQLGARLGQANLAGNLGSGLLTGMFQTANSGANLGMDTLSGLWDWTKNKFS